MKKFIFALLLTSFTLLYTNAEVRFEEDLYGDLWTQSFKVQDLLFEEKSEFQDIRVFNNPTFGKVLAIDGIIQACEKDEFIYHEMMVHVPLMTHPSPKNVLVIGGGDGGTIREVLKHPEIESVTLVELDTKVIEICKENMPELSSGAFENPKVRVVIANGCEFVKSNPCSFDVIIVDSTDPIGPGQVLFTSEFYGDCKLALKDDGFLICQNGCPFVQEEELVLSHQRRLEHFKSSSYYLAPIPTYIGGFMAFGIATNSELIDLPSKDQIEERIALLDGPLKYYNKEVHFGSFALPNYIVDLLK